MFCSNVQDFSFVTGKEVAVIGGGNSVLHTFENLQAIARMIYLHSDEPLSADAAHVELARRYRNLQIREWAGLSFGRKARPKRRASR